MKKLTLFILSIIFSICAFGQVEEEYPKFYIVNGDTVGIILTIPQAQKLDNDLELKKLLEQSLINCDSLSKQYIVVITELEERIFILETKSSTLILATEKQNEIINQLKSKINNYEQDLKLCEDQSNKKDQVIKNQKKTINKLLYGGGTINVILLSIIVAMII